MTREVAPISTRGQLPRPRGQLPQRHYCSSQKKAAVKDWKTPTVHPESDILSGIPGLVQKVLPGLRNNRQATEHLQQQGARFQ